MDLLPPIRTDLDLAKQDLLDVGLARLAGAADLDLILRARTRLIDQARGEAACGQAFREGGRTALADDEGPNQRVWNLVNKGQVFIDLILGEPVQMLARRLLGEEMLLFSSTANIACRGGEAQILHGDQVFAPPDTPYPLLVNSLWMLDDFSDENGATRVVPRSHTAGRWPGLKEIVETLPATGPQGTLLMWDGRLWHGTGVNRTDAPRHAIITTYCRPFVRQQENATVTVSPQVLLEASPELRTLLGFRCWMGLGSQDGPLHGALQDRPTQFSRELTPPQNASS